MSETKQSKLPAKSRYYRLAVQDSDLHSFVHKASENPFKIKDDNLIMLAKKETK